MGDLLTHIVESVPGIWGNKKHELVLGLNNVFTFEEMKSGEIIDGFYLILKIPNNRYYTLRLTELNGTTHDYDIIDVIIFDTLILSVGGKKMIFKSIPPDEYDGEIFNPAHN